MAPEVVGSISTYLEFGANFREVKKVMLQLGNIYLYCLTKLCFSTIMGPFDLVHSTRFGGP